MEKIVLLKKQKDIYILTLNRPEKRNALSPDLVKALHRKIDEIAKDPHCKVLIITGAGKAFCAGADLAYLQELSHYNNEENLADSRNLADLFLKIYRLPKITIAIVNGPALAGGCGLATCCDYIFADAEKAKLGFTEVRIGFIPAIVMNFLIRRIPMQLARHLIISGEIISASEGQKLGLIHQGFSTGELWERSIEFAENLLSKNSFSAMIKTKELLSKLLDLPLSKGLDLASEVNAISRKSADCQRGLKAFLDKQKIQWQE